MRSQTAPIRFYIRLHLQDVTLVHVEPPELIDLIHGHVCQIHRDSKNTGWQNRRKTRWCMWLSVWFALRVEYGLTWSGLLGGLLGCCTWCDRPILLFLIAFKLPKSSSQGTRGVGKPFCVNSALLGPLALLVKQGSPVSRSVYTVERIKSGPCGSL